MTDCWMSYFNPFYRTDPMTIKITHPAVFIFGAGATRGGLQKERPQGVPPPIDSDFFETINKISSRETPQLAGKILNSIYEIYGKTFGIGLEQYYRDIETRAKIISFAKSRKREKGWGDRQKELEELIRRILIQTTCDEIKKHLRPIKSGVHATILRNLKKQDTLITFNYDLVIEESFENADIWNPIDGYGVSVSGERNDWCRNWLKTKVTDNKKVGKSHVYLLKMHGSLNWLFYNIEETKEIGIQLLARPYIVRGQGKKAIFQKIDILAPGWNKKIDVKPYSTFWQKARTKLEDCNSLVILGYSLPETDLLAQALFAEIVRQRKNMKGKNTRYLNALCLVDTKMEVKEKFLKLFTPILSPSSKIYMFENIDAYAETCKK